MKIQLKMLERGLLEVPWLPLEKMVVVLVQELQMELLLVVMVELQQPRVILAPLRLLLESSSSSSCIRISSRSLGLPPRAGSGTDAPWRSSAWPSCPPDP